METVNGRSYTCFPLIMEWYHNGIGWYRMVPYRIECYVYAKLSIPSMNE